MTSTRATFASPTRTSHVTVPDVDFGHGTFVLSDHLNPERHGGVSEQLVTEAGRAVRLLPGQTFDALSMFATDPGRAGALLLRNVPVGQLPATPATPTEVLGKSVTSEFSLLTVARALGQPVGYLPEHGGDIVQNIVPVKASQNRQVSTSSRVELLFHTEAAFHPHRPRYLLLLCLRGDPSAATTLSSVRDVLPHLDESVIDVLFQPRFRTRPDESYLSSRSAEGAVGTLGSPMSVFSGHRESPTLVFDADLMVGTDATAQAALETFAQAVADHHTSVVLGAGDLLIVDNTVAVHGRSPFTPRFDGTDRWLQRTFVVADLMPSAVERVGRIIATRFN